jgi:parallel beta-helix repeat protein
MSRSFHIPLGLVFCAVLSCSAFAAQASVAQGVVNAPCPAGAIAVMPGSSIQAAVDRAGPNASFCLKKGVHRIQVVRPLDGQSFYGEGGTILNGSRPLTEFSREDDYWVATGQTQHGQKHGECLKTAPACDYPEAVFIDDKPLTQVLSKGEVTPGSFYFDYAGDRIYLGDDPTGHKIEATVGAFAFESLASNVLIKNLIIEKYANPAQKGAVHSLGAAGWTVENSELRLNSGAGVVIGNGAKVLASSLHHNGQTGIAGEGNDVVIENNSISANNIYGFDYKWEAGGVKLASSDGVVMRGNHVFDNVGPGLWCDIGCRNVTYEDNVVERNHDAGIFHEISFGAVIRNNTAGNNGLDADPDWFWGADILISASQGVEVTGNTLTVRSGGCGIMLIDQGRVTDSGGTYKTRDNTIYQNTLTFEGAPCAGGVSDTSPDNANYSIITDGNNHFDGNVYRARTSKDARFPWGHKVLNWEGLRAAGLEPNGQLMFY